MLGAGSVAWWRVAPPRRVIFLLAFTEDQSPEVKRFRIHFRLGEVCSARRKHVKEVGDMSRMMVGERCIRCALVLAGVLVLCLALWSPGTLRAQSDLGKISGFVKDPSGATVPNAKVTIRNNVGVERQTTTNESGYYVITNVP